MQPLNKWNLRATDSAEGAGGGEDVDVTEGAEQSSIREAVAGATGQRVERSGIPGVDQSSSDPSASEGRQQQDDSNASTETSASSAEGGSGDAAASGATTNLTTEDIQKILENVLPKAAAQAQATPAAAAAPQMTQEQYEQAFNVYKPDTNLITLLRSEDPNIALKAFVMLRDGLIRQAMTMAEYRMQQYRDWMLQNHVSPLTSYVAEQRATSFRNDFFVKYPDLVPYEMIVDAVATKSEREGTLNGKPRAEIMKHFADDARAVIKQLLANGKTADGKKIVAFTANGNGAQRRMSTLTSGGQGGQFKAGGKPAAKSQGPSGIEVFD